MCIRRIVGLLVVVGVLSLVLGASATTSAYTISPIVTRQLAAVTPTQDAQNVSWKELPKVYGCDGKTDRPHKSSHVEGTVNVEGRSRCKVAMPEIYVSIQIEQGQYCLWRTTICLYWEPWGPLGADTQFNAKEAKANSAGPCVSGAYKGISYHRVKAPHDGRYYHLITWNTARVRC